MSVGLNCTFFGIYYPKPSGEAYKDVSVKYDFMLSPLPPELWSKTARMVLQLKQKAGSTKRVAKWFRENKISIIHSESSRSAHRYATWSLHIAYKPLELETTNEGRIKVIDRLKEKIFTECSKVLFEDHTSNINNAVEAWPNLALNYFGEYNKNRNSNPKNQNLIYEPFELKYTGNGILKSDVLINILKEEERKDHSNLVPALIFAELDTRSQNIRLAVLSTQQKQRFFELGIAYERTGYPDSCIGLIASICDYFPKEYNIWRLNNFSKSSFNKKEEGRLIFLIEDKSVNRDNEDMVLRHAKNLLEEIGEKTTENIKINSKKVASLSLRKAQMRLEEQNASIDKLDTDVFISYSNSDNKYLTKLKKQFKDNNISYFEFGQVMAGESWSDIIKKQLLKAREVCILYSKNCNTNSWIQRELGAAWFLGKRVTPLLINVNNEDLPEILKSITTVKFEDLSTYITAIKNHKDEDDFYSFYTEFLQ